MISAIIERGVATSVVIWDKSQICDPYSDPDWGTSDLDDVYKVELDVNAGPYNHDIVPYFLENTYDEDIAVDAIYQELVDQGYEVLDVTDNGSTYTFETKKGVVSRDFIWNVGYYEEIIAVDNVTSAVSGASGDATVNSKYLVPGESITFTFDRGQSWLKGTYTPNFTVGGKSVTGVTLTTSGHVATATFTVPFGVSDGDVTMTSAT